MITSPNCKVFYRDKFNGLRLTLACESANPAPCEQMAQRLKRTGKRVYIVYRGQELTREMIRAFNRF